MSSLPWVRFYSAKWLSSKTRLMMTASQRSIYLDLLFYLYESGGSIPNNPRQLAALAAVSLDEFTEAWSEVSKNFIPCEDDPGRLTNKVALEVLRETEEKSRSGKLGGRAKAGATSTRQTDQIQSRSDTEQIRTETEKPISASAPADVRVNDSSLTFTEGEKQKTSPSGKKKETAEQAEWFSEFWSAYWLRKAKKPALAAFCKAVKSAERFSEVMAAIAAQAPEMLRREPQHRPHAATWLASERWCDEAPAAVPIDLDEWYSRKKVAIPKIEDW